MIESTDRAGPPPLEVIRPVGLCTRFSDGSGHIPDLLLHPLRYSVADTTKCNEVIRKELRGGYALNTGTVEPEALPVRRKTLHSLGRPLVASTSKAALTVIRGRLDLSPTRASRSSYTTNPTVPCRHAAARRTREDPAGWCTGARHDEGARLHTEPLRKPKWTPHPTSCLDERLYLQSNPVVSA